ncbi:hypothetical protein ENBRE01_2206 [Enteropsectra breve]|nr:hypothetical protein ENBRE01_2206 [Enteropsectra breve]
MFDKTKKMISKTFKKIDYTNVPSLEGYEALTSEYKSVRRFVDTLGDVVDSLSVYEYGGKELKAIDDFVASVSSKVSLNLPKKTTIYQYAAKAGDEIALRASNTTLKQISEDFGRSFSKISKAKEEMNEELSELKTRVHEIKKAISNINEERKEVKSIRYDLEMLMQGGSFSEGTKNRLNAEYNMKSNEVMNKMKEFCEHNGIAGIMHKIKEIHYKFSKTTADALLCAE